MKTKIGIPIGLALVMFLGVFTAMLAFGTLSPQPAEAQTTPSASRSFDKAIVAPGKNLKVTITITHPASIAQVKETMPSGFTYVSGSGSKEPTVSGQELTFNLLSDDSLTYTVMAPNVDDASISYDFSGTLGYPGADGTPTTGPIGGATSVTVVSATAPGMPATPTLTADGTQLTVSWTAPDDDGGAAITGYNVEYRAGSSGDWMSHPHSGTATTATITGLSYNTSYQVQVQAVNSVGMSGWASVTGATGPVPMTVSGFSVSNSVQGPGSVSGYTITFKTDIALVANQDTIHIHFDKDFKGHGTNLSRNHVTVSASNTSGSATTNSDGPSQTGAYNPSSDATFSRLVTADEQHLMAMPKALTNGTTVNNVEYTISVPDMNGSDDGAPGIAAGSTVTLVVSPAAGITNATAGGNKGPIGVYTNRQGYLVHGTVLVERGIALNDYDANRGKVLTVGGKGFQSGTTATVFLDNTNGMGQELVSVPIGSDSTFLAEFKVTVPPFVPGTENTIYIKDGNEPPQTSNKVKFKLEGLLTVSPSSAAVGDKVDITLEDWTDGSDTPTVTIAGVAQPITRSGVSVTDGSANFQIEIHTDTPSGTSEIKVSANGTSDDKKITISGAILEASPTTAVPNQAITVNGQGFTGDSTINATDDRSEVSLGGNDEALSRSAGSFRNFNDGKSITVDSGGSWSATIIVPITTATTTPGTHSLEVMDHGKRSGSVDITIPARTLTIEPAEARPGETVTLTGSGFPATNTRSKEHNTPSIEITYDGDLVGTAIPDGSGNIQLSFRVPLGAAIPSTNRVEANYDLPGASTQVEAFVNHEVPGARVSLSMDEGKPGDKVTVTGDGFKAFASVEYVRIGGIEVTPAPRPATDRNGEFTATILVPDLSEGTNSVEVKVGVTAHANFKVLDTTTPARVMPDVEAAAPADAFAELMAEDNLVRVYHFNKHDQDNPDTGGWSLYDTRDAFMSLNSIDMIEPGEFYWLMMNNEQLNVELGSERVDLVAGWNQIRW